MHKQSKHHEEIKAVDKLLQLAERKHFVEQGWLDNEKFDQKLQIRSRLSILNQIQPSSRSRHNKKVQEYQKMHEKQRLKQLLNQDQNYQQSVMLQPKQQIQQLAQENSLLLKRLKKVKLRGFNSNMTFYESNKINKIENMTKNLTFYKSNSHREGQKGGQKGGIKELRYSQHEIHSKNIIFSEQKKNPQMKYQESKEQGSAIIYFKPNKSQTVRQLLNQMKVQKANNNNNIVLNSFNERIINKNEEPSNNNNVFNDSQYFYDYQMKEMKKYKRFLPFRQNQHLLLNKLGSNDNIWKQRFRESMIRKQSDSKSKRHCFKRLMVIGEGED